MNILSKDAILAADDLPRETVNVPEWGGEVLVRTMSGTDRDAFEASLLEKDAAVLIARAQRRRRGGITVRHQ